MEVETRCADGAPAGGDDDGSRLFASRRGFLRRSRWSSRGGRRWWMRCASRASGLTAG